MIGTYLLLFLFILFFIRSNTKGILVLIIISLINDLFVIPFGFSLAIHYAISLIYIPKLLLNYKFVSVKVKRIIAPLYVELFYLILLAIVFGYIEPWESRFDYQRTWSQRAEGRAIVQVFRLLAEFSLILVLMVWLNTKQITINYLLKATALVISFTVIFALIDTYLFNGILKLLLFSETRGDLGNRFTGLNGEPRVLGRICSYVFLLLISFWSTNRNTINKIGILFSIIGLIISLSASTYMLTLFWGILFIVITQRFKYLFFGIPLILSILFFLNQNEFYKENTLKKMEYVLSENDGYNEKVNRDEPDIFSSFEVFDRAALNFLYNEPLFFIIGTGPNMVSIPSSPYLTETFYSIYEDRIDSVPHSFIINLISRSGIIGIALWWIFFIRFKFALKDFDKEIKALFICTMGCYFIVSSSIFFLIVAVILYIVEKNQNLIRNE